MKETVAGRPQSCAGCLAWAARRACSSPRWRWRAGRAERVRDPVCGMAVDPHTTPHRHQHAGRPYYFCSAGCQAKFAADPAKYLAPSAMTAPPAVPEGTIYTCPMHPQIRQVGRGPARSAAWRWSPNSSRPTSEPNPELVDMTPALLAGARSRASGRGPRDGRPSRQPAYVRRPDTGRTGCSSCSRRRWCCGRAGRSSCAAGNRSSRAISTCSPSLPWAPGWRGSTASSRSCCPDLFPPAFRGPDGAVAGLFRSRRGHHRAGAAGAGARAARPRADSGAIRALLDLAPKTARRIRADGSDEEVALDAIVVGDRLRVRPGEKVPVDGVVIEGRSALRRVDGHGRIDAGDQGRSAPRSSPARSTPPAAS